MIKDIDIQASVVISLACTLPLRALNELSNKGKIPFSGNCWRNRPPRSSDCIMNHSNARDDIFLCMMGGCVDVSIIIQGPLRETNHNSFLNFGSSLQPLFLFSILCLSFCITAFFQFPQILATIPHALLDSCFLCFPCVLLMANLTQSSKDSYLGHRSRGHNIDRWRHANMRPQIRVEIASQQDALNFHTQFHSRLKLILNISRRRSQNSVKHQL